MSFGASKVVITSGDKEVHITSDGYELVDEGDVFTSTEAFETLLKLEKTGGKFALKPAE